MSERDHRVPSLWHILPVWMTICFHYLASQGVYGPLSFREVSTVVWEYPAFAFGALALTSSIALCACAGVWTSSAILRRSDDTPRFFALFNLAQGGLVLGTLLLVSKIPAIQTTQISTCLSFAEIEEAMADSIGVGLERVSDHGAVSEDGAFVLFSGNLHEWMLVEVMKTSVSGSSECNDKVALRIRSALDSASDTHLRSRLDPAQGSNTRHTRNGNDSTGRESTARVNATSPGDGAGDVPKSTNNPRRPAESGECTYNVKMNPGLD